MKKFELIEFPYFSDERGETVPFEFDATFPFPVKRAYFVTGNEKQTRGGHSHVEEKEVFVCVFGSVEAMVNDGTGDQIILLDAKNKGLFIDADCWHEFRNFSPGAVLVAFSSTHFNGRNGYVEDKDEFLKC